MKKLLFLTLFIYNSFIFSQTPQGINYQAVAYKSTGAIVVSGTIKIRLSILNSTSTGTVLYTELHTKTTTAQGLYNLVIGQGTSPTGTFASIPWGIGNKFLKVELDPLGLATPNYTATGTSQLMSVPYALYSENSKIAENINPANSIKTINNIAGLRNISGSNNGDIVFVRGYYTNNDGGGGNFIWNSTSSVLDNNGIIIKPTAITAAGRWVRIFDGDFVNVKWFGLTGNDTNTSTTGPNNSIILTKICNSYNYIFFPKGVYLFTAKTLLRSNTTITGCGLESEILLNNNVAFDVNTASTSVSTNRFKNINISKLTFRDFSTVVNSDADKNRYAIQIKNTDNIKIENNFCFGTNLIITNDGIQGQDWANYNTDNDLCNDVVVSGNKCDGGTFLYTNGASGAISLHYCNKVIIEKNIIENYGCGIMWWGGDADFGVHDSITGNGAMENKRKASRYIISNNIVKRVKGGGIWGSMGEYITITGNVVEDCLDVGIDVERSFFVSVVSNSVKNTLNGCLKTYFGSKDVVFSDNVVEQDNTISNIMASVKNNSQASKEITVSFIGNSFNYTGTYKYSWSVWSN